MARLIELPGVGVKTASCVLLFSLRVPVMPVDTHVRRVAARLGLIPSGMGAVAAHPVLTAATPPGRMLEAHLLLSGMDARHVSPGDPGAAPASCSICARTGALRPPALPERWPGRGICYIMT